MAEQWQQRKRLRRRHLKSQSQKRFQTASPLPAPRPPPAHRLRSPAAVVSRPRKHPDGSLQRNHRRSRRHGCIEKSTRRQKRWKRGSRANRRTRSRSGEALPNSKLAVGACHGGAVVTVERVERVEELQITVARRMEIRLPIWLQLLRLAVCRSDDIIGTADCLRRADDIWRN